MFGTQWTREKLWHAIGVPGFGLMLSLIFQIVYWVGRAFELNIAMQGTGSLSGGPQQILLIHWLQIFAILAVWIGILHCLFAVFPTPRDHIEAKPRFWWQLGRVFIFLQGVGTLDFAAFDRIMSDPAQMIVACINLLLTVVFVGFWVSCVGRNEFNQFIVRLPFGLSRKFGLKDRVEKTELTDDEKLDAFLSTSANSMR